MNAIPDPRIVELLARAESMPDDAAIVTIEQQVLAILIAMGMAWTGVQIHYRHVGIHKCNRHGFGVMWSRFHRLGAKIKRIRPASIHVYIRDVLGDYYYHEFMCKLDDRSYSLFLGVSHHGSAEQPIEKQN